MNRSIEAEIATLIKRIEQHEEIIIQLLEIIATTNRMVDQLTGKSGFKSLSHLH